jgi:uncharacterized protein
MKLILVPFIVIIGGNCFGQGYADRINTARKEHFVFLTDTANHVLKIEELAGFQGLDYYPIDSSFRLTAKLKKNKGPVFKMPTSGTRTPDYQRYAYLLFKIDGKKYKLAAYQNTAFRETEDLKDNLFIPFKDFTSAETTYGGGRYLDLSIPSSKKIVLDFNLAYNPYCAYSHRFSCPVPPRENHLKVRILVGEKHLHKGN